MSLLKTLKTLVGATVERMTGHRVVFHHVPRCGGTSVARGFRLRYAFSQVYLDAAASARSCRRRFPGASEREMGAHVRAFRDALLLHYLDSDVRWIGGHFRFTGAAQEGFGDRYKFMTVLRDPVARFVSDHAKISGGRGHSGTDLSLSDYLETEQGRSGGCVYAKYFSRLPPDGDFVSTEAIEAAVEGLAQLDLVGFTDNLADFAREAGAVLGVRVRVGHENRGRQSADSLSLQLPTEVLARVREVCAADIQIYERVRDRLG